MASTKAKTKCHVLKANDKMLFSESESVKKRGHKGQLKNDSKKCEEQVEGKDAFNH